MATGFDVIDGEGKKVKAEKPSLAGCISQDVSTAVGSMGLKLLMGPCEGRKSGRWKLNPQNPFQFELREQY